ncbi:MAG: hypothetical protein NVS4B10_02930 [Myxococcales bacterium]
MPFPGIWTTLRVPMALSHRSACALLLAFAAEAGPQRPSAPAATRLQASPRSTQGAPGQPGPRQAAPGGPPSAQPGARGSPGPLPSGAGQPGSLSPLPNAPPGQPQRSAGPQVAGQFPVPVSRFGRFDLDVPLAQLAKLPELKACAEALAAPAGHAECVLPPNDDKLGKVQLAWEETKPGGELIALRLLYDPALAPPLTDVEWLLTRGWGPPMLEQLRRERGQKVFTLQWEDPEHRTTLEAAGPFGQGSRVVALVIERKPRPLPGDLFSLRPRPFPGLRVRFVRRVEWDSQPHAVLWGTSLSPAQEALGETGTAWGQQRSYVGVFRLEAATDKHPKRWSPLWERVSGEDEDDPQRVLRVDTRDVTADGAPDVEIELSCTTCGKTTSEVLIKTVRAGKLVDLLARKDLYRAQVDLLAGKVRIREPEGDDGSAVTVTTYAYDRGKGAFVLAREERLTGTAAAPVE